MEEKYSDETLVDIIEEEGLGYAVQYYVNPDKIKNSDTYDLWKAAKEALNNLCLHLGIDD